MDKTKRMWKRMRKYERVAFTFSIVSAISLIVLGFLHLTQVVTLPIQIMIGLMSLLMLAQTVQNWRKNRKPAIYCLLAGIVLGLFGVFVHFAL